jgi:hypothetical protein
MKINITYSSDKEKIFITSKSGYYGSGMSLLLDDITEQDIMLLLDIKRESLNK